MAYLKGYAIIPHRGSMLKFFLLLHVLICIPSFALPSNQDDSSSKQWKRVYLTTFPRSGNHWTRYLIEEASGIATSSLYQDKRPPHLNQIFPWNGYCPDHGYEGNRRYPNINDIVLLKTHFYPDPHHKKFIAAIRIVRHPVDSIYSHYVLVSERAHEVVQEYVPRDFLLNELNRWKDWHNYWDSKPNVTTFRYEDMLDAPYPILKSMMTICNYAHTDEDILRAIIKYPPTGYLLKHLHHFTEDDLQLVEEKLGPLMRKYFYEIPH